MSTTRRTFLKSSAAFTASLPLTRLPLSAARPAPAPSGSRRGLLFDESDLPRIRANTRHPRFAKLWAEMSGADLAADMEFLKNHVRFNNHVADMMRCRQIVERSSFVYAVNNDASHLAAAKLAIRKIIEYPKWDYFLEGGKTVMGLQRAPEATIALAYSLDFLRGALSDEEIADIEHNIATKGAPACFTTLYGMKYPDRVKGWGFDPEDDYPQAFRVSLARWPLILNATNLKIIPVAALGIAAVLMHGRHPQAEQWLDMARSSAKAFSTMYGSDGAYDEGASYWGYTTMHLAIFAETLWRRLGIDDRNLINYPGTVRYALAYSMPTKGSAWDPAKSASNIVIPTLRVDPERDIVNFSDALTTSDFAIAAWVSRTHHDPLAQYCALNIGAMTSHFGFIWFDEKAPSRAPDASLLNVRLSNDIVISRTGWTADDCVVALRSGGPANHEHADRNSVIFKAYGERLFHDPFRAGYSYTIPRWKLRLTAAHTAVLINGHGHQYHDGHEGTNSSWAWARVQSYKTGTDWMTVTSDATEAYSLVLPEVQRIDRTLIYLKPDILLMVDRVTLSTAEPVQLRYQVYNDDRNGIAAARGNVFSITRPFASLNASVHSAGGIVCSVLKQDLPENEGIYPFVEAVSPSATSHLLLTVATAQPSTEPQSQGDLHVTEERGAWGVTGSHRRRKVNVLIDPAGTLPAITLA